MNFGGNVFTLVILWMIGQIASQLPPFNVCPNAPINLQTVHATIYFNGCTFNNGALFGRICSWRAGFTDSDVSITFKVGADVTVENDKYTCMSDKPYDCTCTFKYACLSKLLDQKKLFDFINCAQKEGDPASWVDKCITTFKLDQAVADCMAGKAGYDPKKIALDNAKEVANNGVNVSDDWEPFIFFEQQYDFCTSHQAIDWWAASVCKMLTADKFDKLQNCKDAFNLD